MTNLISVRDCLQHLALYGTAKALQFYNNDLKFVAEAGDFQVMVGGNSRDVQTATFKLASN